METFYETVESLRSLPRGTTERLCTVRGVITRIIPTRDREYVSGKVMTICMQVPRSSKIPATETAEVRINFYDEWAYTASFVFVGDVFFMSGLKVVDNPPAGPWEAPEGFYLVPLKDETKLVAHQKGPLGQTMEVRVTADSVETPQVRGVPQA